MLVIVFHCMGPDSFTIPLHPIFLVDLMETTDKSIFDDNNTLFVHNFIAKIMQDIDVVLNPSLLKSIRGHDDAFDSTIVVVTNPTNLLDSIDKDMLYHYYIWLIFPRNFATKKITSHFPWKNSLIFWKNSKMTSRIIALATL